MKIHCINDKLPSVLSEALDRFEKQFSYPLGGGTSFRISHGEDYRRFFQAMGKATLLVAEEQGEVLGTLVGVQRLLRLPGGHIQETAYLCDLKVRPYMSAGRVMLRLGSLMEEVISPAVNGRGYGVVMSGSNRTPEVYTGRCGIPEFTKTGEIMILRITVTDQSDLDLESLPCATAPEVKRTFDSLAGDSISQVQCIPSLRSMMTPIPLRLKDGTACGVLEDTRLGKRLWSDTAGELLSAHVSQFAYADIPSGVSLLRHAMSVASGAGFPALFVSIPMADGPTFARLLSPAPVLQAPAGVFTCGPLEGGQWLVDTAEI